MKTIVCFGDANTWGVDPFQGTRFSRMQRWPGILRNILGTEYWVIEEGLCGRTIIEEDPSLNDKCGRGYFVPCLQSHTPVDLVIIMLGTNDLKKCFSLSAGEIADGAGILIDLLRKAIYPSGYSAPQVLLIAPPPILETGRYKEMYAGGAEKSQKFGTYFADIAARFDCYFLDAGKIIKSSSADGIHFEAREHVKLGKAVADKVMEIFGIFF